MNNIFRLRIGAFVPFAWLVTMIFASGCIQGTSGGQFGGGGINGGVNGGGPQGSGTSTSSLGGGASNPTPPLTNGPKVGPAPAIIPPPPQIPQVNGNRQPAGVQHAAPAAALKQQPGKAATAKQLNQNGQ